MKYNRQNKMLPSTSPGSPKTRRSSSPIDLLHLSAVIQLMEKLMGTTAKENYIDSINNLPGIKNYASNINILEEYAQKGLLPLTKQIIDKLESYTPSMLSRYQGLRDEKNKLKSILLTSNHSLKAIRGKLKYIIGQLKQALKHKAKAIDEEQNPATEQPTISFIPVHTGEYSEPFFNQYLTQVDNYGKEISMHIKELTNSITIKTATGKIGSAGKLSLFRSKQNSFPFIINQVNNLIIDMNALKDNHDNFKTLKIY